MTLDPDHQIDPFPLKRRPPAQPDARHGGLPVWLWGVLGGGALMMLTCFGGLIAVMVLGSSVMEVEVRDQLRDNPKLRGHIGEVQSFEVDHVGSLSDSDDDTFRYEVRGTLGSGELTVRHISGEDDKEVVQEARLRLQDGTQVQIVP